MQVKELILKPKMKAFLTLLLLLLLLFLAASATALRGSLELGDVCQTRKCKSSKTFVIHAMGKHVEEGRISKRTGLFANVELRSVLRAVKQDAVFKDDAEAVCKEEYELEQPRTGGGGGKIVLAPSSRLIKGATATLTCFRSSNTGWRKTAIAKIEKMFSGVDPAAHTCECVMSPWTQPTAKAAAKGLWTGFKALFQGVKAPVKAPHWTDELMALAK